MNDTSLELHGINDKIAHLDKRVAVLEVKSDHVESQLVTVVTELGQIRGSMDDLKDTVRSDHAAMHDAFTNHVVKEDKDRIRIHRTLIAILLSILGSGAMLLFDLFRKANGF